LRKSSFQDYGHAFRIKQYFARQPALTQQATNRVGNGGVRFSVAPALTERAMTLKSTPLGEEPDQTGQASAPRRPHLRSPVRAGALDNLLDNFIQQLNRQNERADARNLQPRLGDLAGGLGEAAHPQDAKTPAGASASEPGLALDAMKQRIAEFASYVAAPATAATPPRPAPRSLATRLDDIGSGLAAAADNERRWFEKRFDDLARMIEENAGGEATRERYAQIQKRLDEISSRLDRLEGSTVSSETMIAVERRLAELARHLETTKARSETQNAALNALASKVDKLGRLGGQTALAVIKSARQTKEALEAAERTARLGTEVVARHAGEAVREAVPASRFEAIETEVRALGRHTRESGLKAARALEEIHNTMRQFLERLGEPEMARAHAFAHAAAGAAPAPAARPGIIKPVIPAHRQTAAAATRAPQRYEPPATLSPRHSAESAKTVGASVQASAHSSGASDLDFEAQNGKRLKRGLFVAAFIMLLACIGMLYLAFMGNPERAPAPPAPKASLEIGPPQIAREIKQARADRPAPSWTAVSVSDADPANAAGEQPGKVAALAMPPIGDTEDSIARIRRLAEQNHAVSQYRLATLYERGTGVPKDRALAEAWYRRAAEQGNVLAMHNLASLYASGGGAEARQKAIKWFRLAADHGLIDSQYNLGVLLEGGRDSEWPEACKWFTIAAEQGDMEAEWKRVRLRDRMTLAQIRDAETLIAQWKALPWNPDANENPGRA